LAGATLLFAGAVAFLVVAAVVFAGAVAFLAVAAVVFAAATTVGRSGAALG
jgi:hypothetical protein